jgi:hypothetical protein
MAIWYITPKTYDQTNGLQFDPVASGLFTLPSTSHYQSSAHLWWRYDKDIYVPGHKWYDDIPVESTDTQVGLNDITFLQFMSDEVDDVFFLVVPEIDPTIFKTDYSDTDWYFVTEAGDYDPSDFSSIINVLKPEYNDLERQETELYKQDYATQIRELVTLRHEQCCLCETPADHCTPVRDIPEPSYVLSLVVVGFAIFKLLRKG